MTPANNQLWQYCGPGPGGGLRFKVLWATMKEVIAWSTDLKWMENDGYCWRGTPGMFSKYFHLIK